MKTTFSKSICLLASILLALTLTLSCSNDDNPDGGGSSDGGGNGSFAGIPEYERMKERLKYYDPADADERCLNGVVERRCEDNGREVWYNPLTHACDYSESCGGGLDTWSCERTYYELGTIVLCGSQIYVSYVSSPSRRCQGGVIQRKCGDTWYNRETHYCDWDDFNTGIETGTLKAKLPCGNKYYAPYEDTRCQNGVVQEICGGGPLVWLPVEPVEPLWYNYETHYCSLNWDKVNFTRTYTVKPRVPCGGKYLDGDYEKCDNGVILERCGGMMGMGEDATWYNEITQSCDQMTGEVRNKVRCGS